MGTSEGGWRSIDGGLDSNRGYSAFHAGGVRHRAHRLRGVEGGCKLDVDGVGSHAGGRGQVVGHRATHIGVEEIPHVENVI
jgi:hypothetical protein